MGFHFREWVVCCYRCVFYHFTEVGNCIIPYNRIIPFGIIQQYCTVSSSLLVIDTWIIV